MDRIEIDEYCFMYYLLICQPCFLAIISEKEVVQSMAFSLIRILAGIKY